jgi:hypothetical protein
MPEAARRQREREIKLELIKDADMYENFFFSFILFYNFELVVFQLLITLEIQYLIHFLHLIPIINQIKQKKHLQIYQLYLIV